MLKQSVAIRRGSREQNQDDSPHGDHYSSLSETISPIPTIASPEYWIGTQQQRHEDNQSSSFELSSSLMGRNLAFLNSVKELTNADSMPAVDRTPKRSHIRQRLWNDDDSSNHESRQDAVQESALQVSFALQTAREMEQVLDWWKQSDVGVSQSKSLRDNSLVFASPHSTDEESSSDEPSVDVGDVAFTRTPHQEQSQDFFQVPFVSPFPIHSATRIPENATLESYVSPIETVPQREAQEQSFAVEALCAEARRMEGVLAELEDTSVDDDNSVASSGMDDPLWCSLEDLPWGDRLLLIVRCSCQRQFLQLQQWLYHVLPPTLLSTWLSLKSLRLFLLVLSAAVLFSMLYHTTVLRTTNGVAFQSESCLVNFDSLLRQGRYWESDVHYEIHSREWDPWDADDDLGVLFIPDYVLL